MPTPAAQLLPVQLLLWETVAPSAVKPLKEGLFGIFDVGRSCCWWGCAPGSCAEVRWASQLLVLLLLGLAGRILAAEGAQMPTLAT